MGKGKWKRDPSKPGIVGYFDYTFPVKNRVDWIGNSFEVIAAPSKINFDTFINNDYTEEGLRIGCEV